MSAGSVAVPTIIPLRPPVHGQPKSYIDTDTKLELSTATEGATIYYTINGQNPAPFQKHGPAAKSTMRYSLPFRVPSGKRTVKAIAVARDGLRESFVCTKVFDVEQMETEYIPEDDSTRFISELHASDSAKREVSQFSHKMMTSREAWAELQKIKDAEDHYYGMDSYKGHSAGPKYLKNRLGTFNSNLVDRNMATDGHYADGLYSRRAPPTNATQAMRLQRETDFLKCLYCYAPRPADPFARYCTECGKPVPALPQTRISPPEPGQMGTCIKCHSLVPFNTPNCLICEAPIPAQNVPQASIRLTDKTICLQCGTGNPANLRVCVTCNADLPLFTTPLPQGGFNAPSNFQTRREGKFVGCTKCGRVNNLDARFCDWCGTKPAPPTSQLTCGQCQATNSPYSRFCSSCSSFLEPPMRPEVQAAGAFKPDPNNDGTGHWYPITTGPPLSKFDMATQTVGLLYPSQKSMEQSMVKEEERLKLQQSMSDKKPVLTAVSPGKGYWRKQIDHVCSHIKAETSNNAEFRALISEPRLTKVVSSAVHEDGHELSLTVTFALKGNKDPLVGEPMGYSKQAMLSAYTRRKHSISSFASDQESLDTGRLDTGRSTNTARSRRKKNKKKIVTRNENLTVEDRKMLKAVSGRAEVRYSEVEQLLQEGADANVCDKDGTPALHLAVKNKHTDIIPLLISEGANVHKKAPRSGNTALHEAVLMGPAPEILDMVDSLLQYKANPQRKNDKGDSAYEVAIKNGYDSMVKKFTSALAEVNLKKLSATRSMNEKM